jgi:hypothetical protein
LGGYATDLLALSEDTDGNKSLSAQSIFHNFINLQAIP